MAKKVVLVLIVLLLAGPTVYFLLIKNGERKAIRISGNIEMTEVDLAFPLGGEVVWFDAREGDSIRQSEALARLDDEELQSRGAEARSQVKSIESRRRELEKLIEFQEATVSAQEKQSAAKVAASRALLDELLAGSREQQIEEGRAAVEVAEAENRRAQRDWDRAQELFSTEDISRERLDRARAAAETAAASLRQARERLRLLEEGPRQEEIRRGRAELEGARGALDQARARRLEIAKNRQALETLEAELEAARARVEQIDKRIADSRIVAPIDGILLVKSVEVGEVVSPASVVATVADLEHPWIRGYISEPDLGRIRLGMRAEVTTDSYPEKTYEGRVSFIASEAEFTPKQIQTEEERVKMVYRIKVELENPNQELKLNMPVDAVLPLDQEEESQGK